MLEPTICPRNSCGSDARRWRNVEAARLHMIAGQNNPAGMAVGKEFGPASSIEVVRLVRASDSKIWARPFLKNHVCACMPIAGLL
jgi:hypothetical protein